jgi:hypothetical protein
MIVVDDDLRARLVGLEFPVGSFEVPGYEDWIARVCVGAPPSADGLLHPGSVLWGALRGSGFDLDRIIGLCGASWDDGVLFGETSVEQLRPMCAGVRYAVRGRFLDVERRAGRQIAEFDLVTYEMRIELEDVLVGRCTNAFVIPRRSAA